MSDYKYVVEVLTLDKPLRVPRDIQNELKGVVGRKMLRKMKSEAVECPVRGKLTPFLVCFTCKNFVRRFSGKVHCRGLPLD